MLKIFVLFLCLTSLSTDLYSQEFSDSVVEPGMSYQQVLKLLGPPEEKHEFEAKREDLWIYQETKICFKEGQVYKVQAKDESSAFNKATEGFVLSQQTERSLDDSLRPARLKARISPKVNIPVEEILSEVARGMSANEEAKTGRQRPGIPSIIKR